MASTLKFTLLAAIIGGVLFLGGFLKGKPDIVWQSQKLEVVVSRGGETSADVSFIVNQNLEDVSLEVTPELAGFTILMPAFFDSLPTGSVVKPHAIFSVPENVELGTYGGTIHVKIGSRTFAKPLPINITVVEKPPPSPPVPLEIFYDDGTAEGFDFDPVVGRAVYFTKFVSSGDPVKILGAKVFLKIVNVPPSPLDVYVWDINRVPLLIPPHRVTPTGEGWFFVDFSSYN